MSGLEKAPTGEELGLRWELIRGGWRLVEALDAAGRGPDTAFWIWFRDVADWRLMLSGGALLRDGPEAARRRVRQALSELRGPDGLDELTEDLIGIARKGARSVRLIEDALHTGPGIHGIRIRDNVIGGQRIRSAYIYRVM